MGSTERSRAHPQTEQPAVNDIRLGERHDSKRNIGVATHQVEQSMPDDDRGPNQRITLTQFIQDQG
ncbi:hypothetical protein J3Q09_12940 [Pseudomonas sp. R4-83]|uniref:hypothetical protein n=1 Tax=unclassified Pseudomonas TaxID=196821 RepID=UPI003DA890A7